MLGKVRVGMRHLGETGIGVLPSREKDRVLLRGSLGIAGLLDGQSNSVE
jgi:hypothetical protein